MGFLRIKSMPAAVLLSFTAIVTFVYAMNFMFFADYYAMDCRSMDPGANPGSCSTYSQA